MKRIKIIPVIILISLMLLSFAIIPSQATPTDFGNTSIFNDTTTNVDGNIIGQIFTCPENGTAQSITAAIKSVVIFNDIYVRYAIYRVSDWELMGQTDYGVVESQGTGADPEWQTLDFKETAPYLEEGVDYALVVWGINDPYGIYIATGYSENSDGIDLQQYSYWCLDLQNFNYPSTLDNPNSNSDQYSIYCTIGDPLNYTSVTFTGEDASDYYDRGWAVFDTDPSNYTYLGYDTWSDGLTPIEYTILGPGGQWEVYLRPGTYYFMITQSGGPTYGTYSGTITNSTPSTYSGVDIDHAVEFTVG